MTSTVKISALPTGSALTGTEPLPAVQGGATVQTTPAAFQSFILGSRSANFVLAGPTSGSAGVPAFRALVGADLPTPGASSLGGVQSFAAVSHQFLTSVTTAGAHVAAQPAFSDLSGSISLAQLPVGSIFIVSIALANVAATGDAGSTAIPAGIGDYSVIPANGLAAFLRNFSAGATGAVTGTVRTAASGGGTTLFTFSAVTPPAAGLNVVRAGVSSVTTVIFNSGSTPTVYFNISSTTASGTGTVLVPLMKLS